MEFSISDQEFAKLRELVYRTTGINLADAKRQMLLSRLSKRVKANNLDSFESYIQFLQTREGSAAELSEFINAVTTNKTDFFREPHHFDFIIDTVIPEIERSRPQTNKELTIWHAGCSTGEEPYTLAMVLQSRLANPKAWNIRQLATDIDTRVLEHTRNGVYDIERLHPVPEELRKRFFYRGSGPESTSVKVKPVLTEWLSLRHLNLLDETWPIKKGTTFDVILCRNVMIYFDKPTQRTLVERFRSYLKPNGHLIVGHSENLSGVSGEFRCLGKTIYQKVERQTDGVAA